MTAVALATPERCDVRLVTTNVAFRKLDEAEIEATGAPVNPATRPVPMRFKGIAGKFVSRIEGSYSAVVGLPLLKRTC
jgi:septum formation protein